MKKSYIIATMIITTTFTVSGQSPAGIAMKWKEIQACCEKFDDGADSAYRMLNEQIALTQKDPAANAIWHSCLAQFLSNYYNSNRYRLRDRTELADETPEDFKEWDAKTFKRRIREELLLSVNDPGRLQQESSDEYKVLLQENKRSVKVKSLYDILAYRVIYYLKANMDNEQPDLSLVSDELWNIPSFLNMTLPESDPEAAIPIILSLYQELTEYHLTHNHEKDFIMLTLERYDFMRNRGLAPDNSIDWYIQLLEKWAEECEEMQGYGHIACKIGCLYLEKNEKVSDEAENNQSSAKNDNLIKADYWLTKAKHSSGLSFYENEVNRALEGLHAHATNTTPVSSSGSVFPTGSPSLWMVDFANAKQLHFRVVAASEASIALKHSKIFEYVTTQKPVYEEVVDLHYEQDFLTHSGYYILPELPAGAYWLVVSDQPVAKWDDKTPRECILFQVTDIDVIPRRLVEGLQVLVVNRQTGAPLTDAKVSILRDKKRSTLATNRNGFCLFEFDRLSYSGVDEISTYWHGQKLISTEFVHWWYHYNDKSEKRVAGHLFTDRTLYRPGQTVYFKGIFEVELPKEEWKDGFSKLMTNTNVRIILKDPNYNNVDELELTTNEFGSVSSELHLPESGLTGAYQILAIVGKETFYHTISMEEYKLPAFEVNVNEPEETFSIGQTVTVEGEALALAGYPIADAKVSYRVLRTATFPWWRSRWCPSAEERTVAYGDLSTDDAGKFRISFPTEEDKTLRNYTPLYRYVVSVDVTDINGETHSGSASVFVSSRNLLLSCNLPKEINVEESDNSYRISLTNTAGKPQEGTVNFEVFRLQRPERYLYSVTKAEGLITDPKLVRQQFPQFALDEENLPENWQGVSVGQGTIRITKDQSGQFSFPNISAMPDGYYKVLLYTTDNLGNRIESEDYVHVFRGSSPTCSAYEALWCNVEDEVNVGDKLKVTIGSHLPKAHVLCEIYAHGERVSSEWVVLNGRCQTIEYQVVKKDLGSIKIHLLSVNQNRLEDMTRSVSVSDSMLDIRFEFLRFRDKTLPGSQEEYQIRLTDRNGKPVSAELLCSMYDFALDALGSSNNHSLRFYIPWTFAVDNFHTINWGKSFNEHNGRYYYTMYSASIVKDWLDFRLYGCGNQYYEPVVGVRGNRSDGRQTVVDGIRLSKSSAKNIDYSADFEEEEVVLNIVEDNLSVNTDLSFPAAMTAQSAGGSESAPAEQIRTNFNETAFFYPQLRTDEHGDVFISFTMPDALTKWKMQGVAHNPSLQRGRFEKFVQTAKDVMIVPNAPRFLREGDTMDFSAKVVNMSDKHLCGYVTLEFFNAENNRPVAMICDNGSNNVVGRDVSGNVSTTCNTQYDVEPGASQEVHFRIVVPEDVPAVTYRIVAHNTGPQDVAGDGEEKTLPVLTNRMMVTESMPFYISGKGAKTFTFNKLRDGFGGTTLKHYRLTVECTPNPVWYAIQAMPYMMEYPHECNEQRFSRYYANAIATHILKANPVIEEVFNRWQVESPDAFCSALEKNQELKSVVLEETPWVLDAQREGANKQALAAMFDFKRMAKEEAYTLKKLQQAQNGDGGWPWFSGGKSSDFITRHIVAGFGHLKALGVSTDVANSTLRNAVSYMDAQMYQRYLDRKKYHYTYVDETHYLYARSFYKQSLDAKYKAAYDTCYKVLLKGWKEETFYTQAMIALTAWRNGDQNVAKEIVAYLKSMAQHDEEMGMFWKKQGGGWFWYEQPVERQAMLIEAFHTITPEDEESLAQMQLWLLKQKQTQHWGTTKSTTEAVYALLLNQTLVAEDKTVAVTVGDVRLPDESTQTEAGTGYFKKAWTGEEITPDKANVRLEKGTDGPAWGGLYWQYFENLDKITRSDDKNLVIEKQLYKVENTDKGEVLKAITENQPLQKGDKVRVRVVITCDRDMEFVHLKDMRAAAFEPVNVFSQYKYQDGLWYYESTKDAATHFFIDWMPKGKYVFEYTLFATQSGNFSNGITHIECMYAPEFQSHSAGIRVKVR